MTTPQLIIAGCLGVLAIAHSALGEAEILKPLFATAWKVDTPRWAVEKILRFAWHLTSLAWLALAGVVLELNVMIVVGAMCLLSAAIIFVMLRGHLAWPLFLLAGVAAFYANGNLGDAVLGTVVTATVTTLGAAALLHVYWAAGGTWFLDRASPQVPADSPHFDGSPPPRRLRNHPGAALTLAVAGALAAFAALVAAAALDIGPTQARWLVIAGIAVLTLRAIGDTKVAGFTKTIRDTPFGRADDRYFTPLVVFLALGATAGLLT